MEEITSTANKLGLLAEELKEELAKSGGENGKAKKTKKKEKKSLNVKNKIAVLKSDRQKGSIETS